jgi:mannose-1-phosphate guanylyltransferase
MKAVVLVGGLGTRLRPLTYTTPKPLLPVANRPMLEHVLANLARGGVTDAVLALGFRPDAFLECYPSGVCAGVRLAYAVEAEPLDTAGAIRFAAGEAGFGGQRLIVVNGDILTDLDVSRLVAFHEDRGAEASIHLTPVEDPSAFGVVPTDENGRVMAFIEKPPRDQAPTNLINAGTYVLEPSVLGLIPGGRRVSIERETFPTLVERATLYAMATADYWLDTGRPDQYLRANLDRLADIDEDASVADDAVVVRSAIGAGVRVGARAYLTESVLLPGVVIARGARVSRSVLGRDVVVGEGAVLIDSVIGDQQRIEPGARLASARRPESV